MPTATIEEPLVPMYHRYAVSRLRRWSRSGLHLRDARRQPHADQVGVDDQRKALDALASTLRPSGADIAGAGARADRTAAAGLGHAPGAFPRTTGDTLIRSPATVAADVLGFTLQLDRASRMVAQHAVDSRMPGPGDCRSAARRDLGRSDGEQHGAAVGARKNACWLIA
jgi:hypothetical protein